MPTSRSSHADLGGTDKAYIQGRAIPVAAKVDRIGFAKAASTVEYPPNRGR